MSWPHSIKETLQSKKEVELTILEQYSNGFFTNEQSVRVIPVNTKALKVKDIVFCEVKGRLVIASAGPTNKFGRYMYDSKSALLGFITDSHIFGKII